MFKTMLVDKIRHNDGVQAIEYAMVAAFIGLLMTLGLSMLGSNISNEFCSIASEISSGQSKRCNGILSGVSNSYLTAEQGGNGSMTYSYNNGEEGNHGILNALQALNAIDPITGIYGAYNSTTGEPISDYQTLSDYLTPLYNQTGYNQNIGLTAEGEKVQSYADDYQHTDFHMFQVTTKSGQVYNMDYGFQNPTGESDAGSISGKDLQGVGTYSMQNTVTGETVGKSSCDFDGECYGI